MLKMKVFPSFLPWLWLTIVATFSITTLATTSITRPGCESRCGNINIPYPFGIGLDGACSLDNPYIIDCRASFEPPKPFLVSNNNNLEIIDISITGQMRIRNFLATRCYEQGEVVASQSNTTAVINLNPLPLVFSDTANKFTVIGCDDLAVTADGEGHVSGCIATCTTLVDVLNYDNSCSGIGCCQTAIPKGLTIIATALNSLNNHTNVSDFNSCSAAFLAEESKFTFNAADIANQTALVDRTMDSVPVVLDWFVGANETCHQAQQRPSRSGYACQDNTNCTDFDGGSTSGYRCNCLPGYQGNPYLSPGCTDISITGQMRIRNILATRCYQQGEVVASKSNTAALIDLNPLPLVFSDTANKFTVIGCDDLAVTGDNESHISGCIATCTTLEDVHDYNNSCSGIGCCQTAIPKGLTIIATALTSLNNHTNVSDFNLCSAAFLAEESKFTFNAADLANQTALVDRTMDSVPVVLEWFVGVNETCHQARQTSSRSGYACQDNTNCTDFDGGSISGYRCDCLPGYQGNPYLSPGCTEATLSAQSYEYEEIVSYHKQRTLLLVRKYQT
ncbi:wall-associated receptor kinase-like 8 [Beta vulgaris subsp. vulgaris]|uniref:wall-associated receptor kinase-like 8 n=1 Tax=Beta vulgaris subsp. vulgaris TaxID=3555 RepID=UPI002546CDD0|nr:wall-associated receptor kinase-like 8 [Beta vulgaris subsp. vulgaris]